MKGKWIDQYTAQKLFKRNRVTLWRWRKDKKRKVIAKIIGREVFYKIV